MKLFLLTLGMVSLLLGVIGIFIPLLPTTPFLILSAWCFMRSSPRMHSWIYSHTILGPPFKDWEEKGVINIKSKIFAITFLAISIIIIGFKVKIIWLKISLMILLLTVSTFILSRPNK